MLLLHTFVLETLKGDCGMVIVIGYRKLRAVSDILFRKKNGIHGVVHSDIYEDGNILIINSC